jgi:uncharacterized repeat protein (TIGR02543 family)
MPVIAQAHTCTLQISVQGAQYAKPGSISPAAGVSYSHELDTTVTLSAEALPGYTFHWECPEAPSIHKQTGTVSLTMTRDYAVKLVFAPAYYALTLNNPVSGGTTLVLPPVPADMSNIVAGTTVSVEAIPATGYSFVQWKTLPENEPLSPAASSSRINIYISKALTLTPEFSQKKYMFNVVGDPLDIGGRTTGSGYYSTGEAASITATPNDGFAFDKWEVTSGVVTIANPGNANTTVTLGAPAGEAWKVTAKFKLANPAQLSLIVSSDEGGSVFIAPQWPSYTSSTNALPGGSAMLSLPAGRSVFLMATPVNPSRYAFEKWIGPVNDTTRNTTSVVVNAATTVRAQFKTLTRNLTVGAGAAGGGWGYSDYGTSKLEAAGTGESGSLLASTAGVGAATRAFHVGSTVTLSAMPASGYAFAQWSFSPGAFSAADAAILSAQSPTTGVATAAVTMPAAATRITALFLKVPNTYTLTLNTSAGGGATATGVFKNPVTTITSTASIIADGSASYQENTTVNLTATPSPATHFKFGQWSGGSVVNPYSTTTTVLMNAAKTVTAVFQRTHADLTVSISPAGAGSVIDNGTNSAPAVTHAVGSVVKLRPVAANGAWTFKEWKVDGVVSGNASPLSVTMNDNHSVEAFFVMQHTLTTKVNPAAAGNASPGTKAYLTGDTAYIDVAASTGWIFDHWSGDVAGISPDANTKPASFVMISDRTVTAEMTQGKRVTITALASSDSVGGFNPNSADGTAIKATGSFYNGTTALSSICHQAGTGVDTAYVAPGATITLSAPPTASMESPKWRFVRWEDQNAPGVAVGPAYTVTKDVTLRAIYSDQRVLTANVTVNGAQNPPGAPNIIVAGNSLCAGDTKKLSYSASAPTNVNAPAATSLVFTGWSGPVNNAAGLASNTVTMDNDKTLAAAYRTSYVLTTGVLSVPSGASLNLGALVTVTGDRGGSSPTYTFADGDQATLAATATVAVGTNTYKFKGWDTTNHNDGTVDVTETTIGVSMNSNKTIKAVYARQIAVTFKVGTGNGSTVPPAGVQYYNYGDNISFSANPGTGYSFDRWGVSAPLTFSNVVTSPANAINNLTVDCTVTANFKLRQNAVTARILVDGVTPTDPAVANLLVITADGTVLKNGESKEYNYNTLASLTAATPSSVPGYHFAAWSCPAPGFTASGTNTASFYVLSSQTVTASYQSVHALTLDQETRPASAGTGGTVSAAGAHSGPSGKVYGYLHNTAATLTATASPGFQFIGWSVDGSATLTTGNSIVMAADHDVKAVFAKTCTLTLAVNPSAAGTTTPAAGVATTCYHGQEVSIGAIAGAGYTFGNWTSSLAGSVIAGTGLSSTKITIAGDTTATANFTADATTLTGQIKVNGTIQPATFTDLKITADGTNLYSTQTKGYFYNDPVNVTASTAAGYKFTGWSGALSGVTNPGSFTMNATAKTAVAEYKTLHTVTIQTETLPSGTGGDASATDSNHESVSGKVYTYAHGAGATLTAVAETGYRLIRWEIYENGSSTPTSTPSGTTCTITVNNNIVARAIFAKEYTLTFTPNYAAGGTINKPATYTACHGEVITSIVATPNDYWAFDKWSVSGDAFWHGSQQNPIPSYTVTHDQAFIANFRQTTAGAVVLTVIIKLDDVETSSTTFSVAADGSTATGLTAPSVLHGGDTKQYFIYDMAKLDAASVTGYDFVTWDDNSTNTHRELVISASRTVTALYRTKVKLTMAMDPGHVGNTDPATGTHTSLSTPIEKPIGNLYKGMTVPINSILDGLYTDTWAFTGWTVAGGADVSTPSMEQTSVLLDVAEKAATAHYVPGYKLEVRVKYENTANPGDTKAFAIATGSRNTVANGYGNRAGIYLSDPNSLDYSVRTMPQNGNASIRAIPAAPGYTFVGWTTSLTSNTPDAGLTANTLSVVMDAPKTYTAIFEKVRVKLEVYTIPSSVTGVRGEALNGALVTGPEPRVYDFFHGATASLKATSETSNYGFVAWFKGSGYTTDPSQLVSKTAETTYPEALTAPVTKVTAYFLPYGLHRLILFIAPEPNVDIHHVSVPGAVSQTYTTVNGRPACVADVGITDPYSSIPIHADSSASGKPNDNGPVMSFHHWEPDSQSGETNDVYQWIKDAYSNDTEIDYPMARAEVRLVAIYADGPAYRLQLKWEFTETVEMDPKYADGFLTIGYFNDLAGNISGDTMYSGTTMSSGTAMPSASPMSAGTPMSSGVSSYPVLQVNRKIESKSAIFTAGHVEKFSTDAAFAAGPFLIDHWTDEQPDGTVVNSTPSGGGATTFASQPGIIGTPQTVTAYINLVWYNINIDQPVLKLPLGWSGAGATITGSNMFGFLKYETTKYPADIFYARQVPDASKNPSTLVAQWQRVKGGSAPVLIAAGTPAGYRFAGWDINGDGNADFSASNFSWDAWPSQWAREVTADRTVAPVYVRRLNMTLAMQGHDINPGITATDDKAYFYYASDPGGIEVDKLKLTETRTYDYGTTFTVTAVPQTNHVLQKWIIEKASADGGATFDTPALEVPGDGTPGTKTYNVTLDYPTKVTAVFAMQPFDLTVDVADSADNAKHGKIKITDHEGIVHGPGTSETCSIPYGKFPAIEAMPDAGYVFVGWQVTPATRSAPTNPGAASTTVEVDGDKTVTAYFVRAVTLTMAVTPGTLPATMTNPNVGTHTHYASKPLIDGSQVPIEAGTDGGYDFVEWQITDDNGTRTLSTPNTTLTLEGNTVATAVYAELFDVTLEATPVTTGSNNNTAIASPAPKTGGPMTAVSNGFGGNTAKGAYRENTDVIFTATASAHYEFDHWELTIGGTLQPGPYLTTTSITQKITAKTTARAVFKPRDYVITVKPYNITSGTLAPIATALNGAAVATPPISPPNHNFLPPPQSTGSETWTLPYNASVTLSTAAGPHYVFEKWSDASRTTSFGNAPANASANAFTVSGDQTIYALFKRAHYFLTTELDPIPTPGSISSVPSRGGSNPSQHNAGDLVTLTATVATGVAFDRWSGDIEAATTTDPVLPLTMDKDRSVKAHFVDIVTLAVKIPDPSLGTVTVTGAWSRVTPTVVGGTAYYTFIAGASASISVTVTSPALYQFDNWTFSPGNPAGVTTADLTNSTLSFAMPTTRGDTLTVDASFSARPFNLTVSARAISGEAIPYGGATPAATLIGSGSFSGGLSHDFLTTPTASVRYNTTVQLSTTANDYYGFVRWTDGNLTASHGAIPGGLTYVMPGQDQTVVALYQRNLYKLTVHKTPAGFGTVTATPAGGSDPRNTPDTTVYAPNTNVTLLAGEATGKIFTGWTGTGTASASVNGHTLSLTMNTDRDLTANFANAYKVTIPATPHGSVTLSGNSPYASVIDNGDGSKTYIFAENTTATITATPASQHYYISEWTFAPDISASVSPNTGGDPKPATITFTVTQDVTVKPVFDARVYTLNVMPAPPGAAAALVGHEDGSLDHDFLGVDTVHRKYPTVMTLEATAKDEPKAHYRFDSWEKAGVSIGTSPTYVFTFDGDAKIRANFVRQVQITINNPQDVTGANNAPPIAVCGTVTPGAGTYRHDVKPAPQTITITATATEGFEFAGWLGAGGATTTNVITTATSSTATLTYTITDALAGEDDIVLTPTFKRRLYAISVGPWEQGLGLATVCGLLSSSPMPDVMPDKFCYGTQITVRINQVYTGYRFVGWGWGDDIGSSRIAQQAATGALPEIYTCTVTADKHITAVFTKVCTLEIVSDPADGSKGTATIVSPAGRAVPGQPTRKEFDYGTRVYIEATPAAGSSFLGWAGDVNDPGALSTYVDLKANRSVVARYTTTVYRDLTVKVVPSSGGSVTIDGSNVDAVGAGTPNASTITKQMLDGTTAQLVATAAAGYIFSSWSPAGAITITDPAFPSTGVLMNANKTVTANFVPVTYTLTVQAMPAAGGTVTGGGTSFAYNAAAPVSATANPGYTFKGWDTNGDGVVDITTPSTTIQMTTDRFASAIFVPAGQSGAVTVTVMEEVSGTWVQNEAAVSYKNISPADADGIVTIACRPAAGYSVAGGTWGGPDIFDTGAAAYDQATDTYTLELRPERDMVVYFLVSIDTVRLTWAALPSGAGSVTCIPAGTPAQDGGFLYRAGTAVRVVAHAVGNRTFAYWQGALSGANADTSFTITANSHVEAYFEPSNTWTVKLNFDLSSRCDPADKVTMDGTSLRWDDDSEIVKYYKSRSHIPLSYVLTDPDNHIFEGWLGVPSNAIVLMVKPDYDLYIEGDLTIRALIMTANPLLETRIRLQNIEKEWNDERKTPTTSIGGSISYGDVVSMGDVVTVRVTLEHGYLIDHWGIPSGGSTLSTEVTAGVDPESGKEYVERKVTVRGLVTTVEVFLISLEDAGNVIQRRNIVEGNKDLHDDVPKTRGSGHFIDGTRTKE